MPNPTRRPSPRWRCSAQPSSGRLRSEERPGTRTLRSAPKAQQGGHIPYTGGPASRSGKPDPFAADKPLFSITAANLAHKADGRSSQGLFKKFPDYRMDVYPSRRSAAFPQTVLDNTVRNATRCKTLENGLALATDCRGGLPFPIMKSGEEAMWNHLLRFQGYHYDLRAKQFLVDSAGRVVNTDEFTAQQEWPYSMDKVANPEIYYRVRSDKLQTRSVGVINTYTTT